MQSGEVFQERADAFSCARTRPWLHKAPSSDWRRFLYKREKRIHNQVRKIPSARLLRYFRESLLKWSDSNGRCFSWRKASANNYQRIVAEILLQRTKADTVARFFPTFVREFPSWKRLSLASVHRLQHYLRPIGLWRRRAVSIQALSREMAKRNGRFPPDREDIETLPGIGQYIANAVLMFCYGACEPLLDVNMARVLERFFGPRQLADIRYDPYLQSLAKSVITCRIPASLNWAILDLAALVCVYTDPRCNLCPLSRCCKFCAGMVIEGRHAPLR